MNLKEAFRYQNKIKEWMRSIDSILCEDRNVMKTERTYLRSKVMSDAADERVVETMPSPEYADHITDLVKFNVALLEERKKLYAAIRAAKAALPIDMDSEVSLNDTRRVIAMQYRYLADKRPSENLISNGGTGYRFNAEGNQVQYKCDMKCVSTINFDRKVVRKLGVLLQKEADEASTEIDRCMINTTVDYTPIYDVNDSFAEIFQVYCEAQKSA